MKLTYILPLLLIAGVGTVAVRADNIAAQAVPGQIDKNPSNRLGAELAKDLDAGKKRDAERARKLEMQKRMFEAATKRSQAQAAADAANPAAAKITKTAEAAKAEADEAANKSIMQLVKVYQTMKPKPAAVVFERLDLDIQVAVASKMRSQAMAKLMAAMTPEGASKLTTALARPMSIASAQPTKNIPSPPKGLPITPPAPR